MDRVYLFPTTMRDFEDYYLVRSDPADIYWNGYKTAPEKEQFKRAFAYRTADARFVNDEDRRNYLIKLIDTRETIGFIQLIHRGSAIEIGYSVMTQYQKRGYATESIKLAVTMAQFYNLDIIVRIRDDNTASQKAVLKNGFKRTEEFIEKEYPLAGCVKLRTYRYLGE